MDETFELPVEYKGEQLMLNTSLQLTAYNHKFLVVIAGQEIIFEPDEERNYRAVLSNQDVEKSKLLDMELIKNIADAIQKIVK